MKIYRIIYFLFFFGIDVQRRKNYIVFEKENYQYQKYISDLSGADITAHNNKIEECIISIRNWLKTSSSRDTIPYGNIII